MHSISSLIKQLSKDYPEIHFTKGAPARWASEDSTIYYDVSESHADWTTLHELAHALLRHQEYNRDIELVRIESDAWSYAQNTLAPRYDITIDQAFADTQLDSYRDWLHTKSTCPKCQSSGVEIKTGTYSCPHCHATWRTNTGIETAVRRYKK